MQAKATVTHYIDDREVVAVVSARAVRSDYGVPRSPTFYEMEDMTLVELEIDGEEIPRSEWKNHLTVDQLKALENVDPDLFEW